MKIYKSQVFKYNIKQYFILKPKVRCKILDVSAQSEENGNWMPTLKIIVDKLNTSLKNKIKQ